MTIHFFFNPKSGKGQSANANEIVTTFCEDRHLTVIRYPIENPVEINEIAKRAVKAAALDDGVLLAAGGDGTLRAAAHAARGTHVKVAAMPLGTFNWFARAHEIPDDPLEALKIAVDGIATPIRLAEVNGETFILNASAGAYADSIRERKVQTKRFGRNRIVAACTTMRTLLGKNSVMDVAMKIDGTVHHQMATTIFVGNNALQLRDLNFEVASCMHVDDLALITLKQLTKREAAYVILHGLLYRLDKTAAIDSRCVGSMSIHLRRKEVEVALDGELFTIATPLEIRALPNAMILMRSRS